MTLEEALSQKRDEIAQKLRDFVPIMGEEAVHFTQENFDKQGWQGDSFEPWQKRKNPNAWGKKDDTGRAILTGEKDGGKLKQTIRSEPIQGESAVYLKAGDGVVRYARVHNEGFSGAVNQNVGESTRKGKKGQIIIVSAFKRTIQQNIPKRKFIGGDLESSQLRARIKNALIEHMNKK